MLNGSDIIYLKKKLLKMHYDAGVGHIGGNLSCFDFMMVLFYEFLKKNTFILSKGHSAGSLYLALWLKGILKDRDLKTFHKNNTNLPGHPPLNKFKLIPFSTGSLGHGLPLSSGVALANKLKNNNKKVFCLMSDGEWEEGSNWEALIFACHHKLSNLVICIDKNNLQGFGYTNDVASLDISNKLKSFDVDFVEIDGHSLKNIRSELSKKTSKIKVIVLNTIKGNGITFMENKLEWHYKPLTSENYKDAILELQK